MYLLTLWRRMLGLTLIFLFSVVCSVGNTHHRTPTAPAATPIAEATEPPSPALATASPEPSIPSTLAPAATVPARVPLQFVTGRNDYVIDVDGTPRQFIVYVPFPFLAEEIVNDPNFGSVLLKTTTLLGLEMSYAVQSEPQFTTLTFDRSLAGADNEYVFRMVRGMGHVYPSGDNNRAGLNVSDLFWEFFIRHSKP